MVTSNSAYLSSLFKNRKLDKRNIYTAKAQMQSRYKLGAHCQSTSDGDAAWLDAFMELLGLGDYG